MKIYISAQAQQKQEMIWDISHRADIIIEHLIKLILMPNSFSRKHWQGEIAGQLNKVQKLKSTNKYPTAKQIYEWTYTVREDTMQDINQLSGDIENVEFEYDALITMSAEELSNILLKVASEYFSWLANILAIQGRASNSDIYAKLDELL